MRNSIIATICLCLLSANVRAQTQYLYPPSIATEQLSSSSDVPGGDLAYQPSITVEELPNRLDIPGGNLVMNIIGFKATVTNAGNARFFVPDGRNLNVSCDRLTAFNNYCGKHPGECRPVPGYSCFERSGVYLAGGGGTCATLGLKDKKGKDLVFPLFTLEEWSQLIQPVPPFVMFNANWFNVQGPPSELFPHNSPCTEIFGYSANDGAEISTYDNPDMQANEKLDMFLVRSSDSAQYKNSLSILTADQFARLMIHELPGESIRYAVGGFILAENGKVRSAEKIAKGTKPINTGARTAIGLSEDGQTMHVVVVQRGRILEGITALDIAAYMTKVLKDSFVINLDNGGSSQFISSDGHAVQKSLPSDDDGKTYRPIPNFLAVSTPQGDPACGYGGLDERCQTPKFKAEHQELKKRTTALSQFESVGQYYSNDAFLFDDSNFSRKGSLEDCAQRCLDHPLCSNYAYKASSKYCTLFPAGTRKLPSGDYQMYQRNANPLFYGVKYHIQNGLSGWDAKTNYLDVRNAGCNANLLCVSLAGSSNRDSGSGTWRILSATGKREGETVLSGDQVYLQNQYNSGAGGYLDSSNAGVSCNLLCVSTATSSNRDSGSGTWRIIKDESGGIVLEDDVVHLWNGWNNWTGGFLDTRVGRCEGNLYCVSTSQSWNRDGGSTHWRFQKQ